MHSAWCGATQSVLRKDFRGKLSPSINDLQKRKLKILGYSIIVGIGFSIVGLILGSALTAIILYLLFELGGSQCIELCGSILIWFSTVLGLMMASLMGVDYGRRTYRRLSRQK